MSHVATICHEAMSGRAYVMAIGAETRGSAGLSFRLS